MKSLLTSTVVIIKITIEKVALFNMALSLSFLLAKSLILNYNV